MRFVLAVVFLLLPFSAGAQKLRRLPVKAAAHLKPTAGRMAGGTATFTETPEGLRIQADISGLPPGKHGLHIHEYGDCSADDAASAGDHFNPLGLRHGGPEDVDRHAGDLGNITANEDGNASVTINSTYLSLFGDLSVLGRSIIVHQQTDDFKSQPTGDAGERLACGVVGVTGY